MKEQLQYRGMTEEEGVRHVEAHFEVGVVSRVKGFSELHEYGDANIALPFFENVGDRQWLDFVNAVIARFDYARSL